MDQHPVSAKRRLVWADFLSTAWLFLSLDVSTSILYDVRRNNPEKAKRRSRMESLIILH